MGVKGCDLTVSELLAAIKCKFDDGELEREVIFSLDNWNESDDKSRYETQFSQQLETATSLLRILRYHHNVIQPINQLPIHILTTVFELLQCEIRTSFPPLFGEELDDAHSWMTVTQVCQHWRDAALTTPSLWRYIAIGRNVSEAGLLAMMHFERSAPLPVLYHDDRTHCQDLRCMQLEDFYAALLENTDRIEAIHTSADRGVDCFFYDLLKDHPLPTLKSIQLAFSSQDDEEGVGYEDACVPMGSIPLEHLEKLSLHNFHCISDQHAFNSLTHLSLQCQEASARPSLASFLALLKRCPLLQCLRVADAGPIIDDTFQENIIDLVTLPFLTRAEFWIDSTDGSRLRFIRPLLHHLEISLKATIVSPIISRSTALSQQQFLFPPVKYLNNITDLHIRDSPKSCYLVEGNLFIFYGARSRLLDFDRRDLIYLSYILPSVKSISWQSRVSGRLDGKDLHRVLKAYKTLEKFSIMGGHLSSVGFISDIMKALAVTGEKSVCPSFKEIIIRSTGSLAWYARDFLKLNWAERMKFATTDVTVITQQRPHLGTTYDIRVDSENLQSKQIHGYRSAMHDYSN